MKSGRFYKEIVGVLGRTIKEKRKEEEQWSISAQQETGRSEECSIQGKDRETKEDKGKRGVEESERSPRTHPHVNL